MISEAQAVLTFWFEELQPADWFRKSDALDRTIDDRFSELHRAAAACELFSWRESPHGRLAEILVLDQFSRNIFRDTPAAFGSDALALALAQEAVYSGLDQGLSVAEKAFLYMPYMHSESRLIHEQAVSLFSQPGLENNLDFEIRHKQIIDRFGRYPHRNTILGQVSTEEEQTFLQQPDSSF